MKFSTGFAAAVMGMGLGMGVLASPMSKNPPGPIASSEPSSTLTLPGANKPQSPSPTPTNLHNPPNPQLILLPHPTNTPSAPSASPVAIIHPRTPQQTCSPNSGTNNSGCNNSGVGNSGTSNSGINNCGTGNSGVGVGCTDAAVKTSVYVAMSATTVYVVSTVTVDKGAGGTGVGVGTAAVVVTTVRSVIEAGTTATQTIVVNLRGQRYGCAYWKAQGFTCSPGSRSARVGGWGWGVVGAALVGVVLL